MKVQSMRCCTFRVPLLISGEQWPEKGIKAELRLT